MNVKITAVSEKVPVAIILATNDWELGTVRNDKRYAGLRKKLQGLNHRVEDYSGMAIGLNYLLNKAEGKPFAQDFNGLVQSVACFTEKYQSR